MMAPNSVERVKRDMQARLEPRYGRREAGWIVRVIFEHVMGWDTTALLLHATYELNDYTVGHIADMVSRVADGEPVQYVTGEAPFYGMTLEVNRSVLIPRPETAELVDLIVSDYKHKSDLKVLDCGTGSGCIAIALARHLPFSAVTAVDISGAALDVARRNAEKLRARVEFVQADLLSVDTFEGETFDVIVSNPPYIANREKSEMESHVLDYEPPTALFVPDNDPLMFYWAVSNIALRTLVPGGKLFFEINPLFVSELRALLSPEFDDVDFRRDSQGKVRFAIATKILES